MLRKAAWVAVALWMAGGTAWAQGSRKLALIIPDLYGDSGLHVDSDAVLPDGSTHSAHFNSAFQTEFTQFNIALASQLAAIPLPSPASGFTYTFDSSLGVFQRSTESFGPILAERAETIGRKKFTFGVTYQYFNFKSLEGVSLSDVPAVFTHDDSQLGGGRSDVVTTTNSIATSVNQAVVFLSYGLGNHVDLSLAVPFVNVDLSVRSDAKIDRVGTSTNPAVHFFGPGFGDERVYSDSGHASGIGDLVLRLKANPVRNDSVAVAFGVDARLPTGDELNFLGLGAAGVKPFAIVSLSHGRVAPHLNVSYQWNGKSVLAGDPASGTKADLPDQVSYAVGADIGVSKRVTLGFDFLGTHVIDSPRLVREVFTAANGNAFPQIGFVKESYNMGNGAVGLKFNPVGQMLIDLNLLFKLDSAGLRANVTPLVGIEYAF
ncbi:MAG: hypothetical protein ACM3PV_05155 [Betaproteobacteria bacterium]